MEGMTFAMLLYYMTGFPLQLAVAVIPFFLPLKKKQRWPLRLPLAILLPAVEIGLGLLLYPRLALTEFSSQLFFAAHFLLICALYGVGLCILTEASPLEASYCAVCAYMTQHLFYCIALVRSHLLDMPAWWETEAMVYVRLALVCAAVYLLFVRRICRDGHYPNSVLRALTLYTLVMAVMFFLSIRVSDMDNGWLHGLYTGMLIIILMMEEERSAEQLRLQEEMQTRERMESTQRAQYEMSKENIALLNRKSHDLRRQVAALRTVGTLEEQEEVISEIEQAVAIYDSTFQTGSRALDTRRPCSVHSTKSSSPSWRTEDSCASCARSSCSPSSPTCSTTPLRPTCASRRRGEGLFTFPCTRRPGSSSSSA